jgi:hypothetical protein
MGRSGTGRGRSLPREVRATIAAALATVWPHEIPGRIPLRDRVFFARRDAAGRSEHLQLFADRDERGFFIDYYRVDNDGERSRHGRIREDGTAEPLENLEGQFGFPVFPDDPERTERERERIFAHNIAVLELLRAKGFIT